MTTIKTQGFGELESGYYVQHNKQRVVKPEVVTTEWR